MPVLWVKTSVPQRQTTSYKCSFKLNRHYTVLGSKQRRRLSFRADCDCVSLLRDARTWRHFSVLSIAAWQSSINCMVYGNYTAHCLSLLLDARHHVSVAAVTWCTSLCICCLSQVLGCPLGPLERSVRVRSHVSGCLFPYTSCWCWCLY